MTPVVRRPLGPIVFFDGAFLAAERARISVFDRGLLFGDGVFETIRTYHGVPYELRRHLQRLREGVAALGFRLPHPDRWWAEMIGELVRRNLAGSADHAVRLTVTRGVGGPGLLPAARPRPTVIAGLRPLDPRLTGLRRRGAAVTIVPFHPGRGGVLGGFKTTHYAPAVLAKRVAAARSAFEGIYSSPDGELFEGATSNLFLVHKRRLSTPPAEGTLLPGITRLMIMGLAREVGLEVCEERVTVADLASADEAFLTATTIEVLPIRAVDGRRVGRGGRSVIRSLQEAYCAAHPPGDCRA